MEYEDRDPALHICEHCRYFAPDPVRYEHDGFGLCKKHPKLHQKHDDTTYRELWCQYWEQKVVKQNEVPIDREEAMDAAVEHREELHSGLPEVEQEKVEAHYRLLEAETFQRSLKELYAQQHEQIINATANGSVHDMLEARGMFRITKTLLDSIDSRIQWLTKQTYGS